MNKQKCPTCGSPATSQLSGSITQWISSCSCYFKDTKADHEQLLSVTVRFCTKCKKRIVKNNSGSLTQWIFGKDTCQCESPEAELKQIETRIDSIEQLIGKSSVDSPEETLLEVDDFPDERYKPRALLGKGATGTVYLCRDKLLNKMVAVKTIQQLTGEQLISFQTEAKVTSQLNHPNLLTVLDFGATDKGSPYMVIDYFSGVSLQKYIHDYGALDEIQLKSIFLQLASALEYAHQQGVYHRDITPSNLLINIKGDDTNLKLIDFGIAKVKEEMGFTTSFQKRTLAGTPAYMSPDTANGLDYDQTSEVYSLGCVMYESFTGTPPFKADTALEVLALHINQAPAEIVEAGEQWSEVISKCLAKRKEDRYQSMGELKSALKNIIVEAAEEETRERVPQETDKNLSKSQVPVLVAIVLGLVAISGYFFYSNQTSGEVPEKTALIEEKESSKSKFTKEDLRRAIGNFEKRHDKFPAPDAPMESFQIFKNFAGEGNLEGMHYLAASYMNGFGVKRNYKEAFEWSKKAEAKGSKKVLRPLGSMYLNGLGVKRDPKVALEYFERALPTDPSAAFAIGRVYQFGLGVKKDYKKSMRYYRHAANQGYTDALVNIAVMYESGFGVEKNTNMVVENLETAAKAKNATALKYLTKMYQFGIGIDKDYKKAYEYCRKAAETGDADSLAMLGDFYYYGHGVPRDYKRAWEFYSAAVDQNGKYGVHCQAWCYQYGNYVKKDLNKAAELYRKAIKMGHTSSTEKLKEVTREMERQKAK